MSEQSTCTILEKLYCKEVDGIIVSPTTIVQQHKDLYSGFTINVDVYKGIDEIKLVHRDRIKHITSLTTLINGL